MHAPRSDDSHGRPARHGARSAARKLLAHATERCRAGRCQRRCCAQLCPHLASLKVHATVDRVAHNATCTWATLQRVVCSLTGAGLAWVCVEPESLTVVHCQPHLLPGRTRHFPSPLLTAAAPPPRTIPRSPSAALRPPPPPQCAHIRTSCAYWRSSRFQREASTAAASCGAARQRSQSGREACVCSSQTAQWRER